MRTPEHPFSFFFFQAEDGIRDIGVTGVQTCALPISPQPSGSARRPRPRGCARSAPDLAVPRVRASRCVCLGPLPRRSRSEERRVGKECRSRWLAYLYKIKKDNLSSTRG